MPIGHMCGSQTFFPKDHWSQWNRNKELSCRRETTLQVVSVLDGWSVMAWVRQYSAPNDVGDRKLKAVLCVFEPLFGMGGLGATYAVHLRLLGNPVVDFLLVIIELFV